VHAGKQSTSEKQRVGDPVGDEPVNSCCIEQKAGAAHARMMSGKAQFRVVLTM
jgi:hypothetical protein